MHTPPRRKSLVWHVDFRQLWIADALSQVGAQLTALALPIYAVQYLGASELEMGYLSSSQTIAFLILGLPAGVWVDRMLKRSVLIWSDVLRALVLGAVVAFAVTGNGSMAMLYIAGVILSVATVFFDIAHLSYLPGLVGLKHISEGNTKLQATYSIAAVAVPAVGGLLLRVVSAPLLIAVNVVTYVVSVVFLGRIRHREQLPDRSQQLPLLPAIREGLTFIVTTPLLNRLVFVTAVSAFFSTMGWAMVTFYVLTTLDLGEGALGVIMSASAVGGILGAIFARMATVWIGEGRIIALSALASPIMFAGIPLAWHLRHELNPQITLIVAGFLMQISVTLFNVAQVSFRQRLCPPHLLGRMNASFRFIVWGTMPFAGVVGGMIAHQFGVVTMLWVVVIGEIAAALPLVFSRFMTLRELPSTVVETVEDTTDPTTDER
ncbi:MFS transporter [Jonesia quinghaiensis]|uniref:MFS transporter n=1 Tax=Jonesia quinghaiensis TaxID=262806 RepID=UPI00040DD2C3|nr:MFS transporter [Jonesia quinghaiensis]